MKRLGLTKRCNRCSRRTFFQRLFLVGSMLGWIRSRAHAATGGATVAIPLDKVPPLQEIMGGALLKLKGLQVLLIRTEQTKVSALDPECRHKKCRVLYEKEWGEIRCDCHGSRYDVQGHVINPPAKRNLRRYTAELQGDRIILNLSLVPDDE